MNGKTIVWLITVIGGSAAAFYIWKQIDKQRRQQIAATPPPPYTPGIVGEYFPPDDPIHDW